MAPVDFTAWLYNSNTGTIMVGDPVTMSIILKTGNAWHGIFHNRDDVTAYYNANKAAHPQWKAPTSNIIDQAGNTIDTAQAKAQQVVDSATSAWTAAINTAVKLVPRVLEAAVGIVLLAIAANAILKQTTGVDVAGAAVRGARRGVRVVPVAGAVVR